MITKEKILKSTTVEDIVSFYIPDFKPKANNNYKSPFSEKDDKHSLAFYYEGSTLKFKSHNTTHQGDIFQLVADIEKLDCKSNFQAVLEIINTNLQLNLETTVQAKNIKVTTTDFTSEFLKYFKQFGITHDVLFKYKVQQVQAHEFINSKGKHCKFDYDKSGQIVACYNVNGKVKIYIPEIPEGFNNNLNFKGQKKAFGFKDQTSNDVFGLAQLPKSKVDFIIICAGEKDCLASISAGFTAISLQSENQLPQQDLINSLKGKCKDLIVCYDTDTAGKNASKKIQDSFGIPSIQLPEGVKDVADYFSKFKSEDFDKIVIRTLENQAKQEKQDRANDTDGTTLFHISENYLSTHYDFRYNTIKHDIEYSKKGKLNFVTVNENELFRELNKSGIKISIPVLIAILRSDFVPNYNPFNYYFENLKPWKDGDTDHIGNLSKHVTATEQQQFETQFKKWLVRCVACALVDEYYNKQAFILVHSAQNSGKSTFCRFICPPALREYIAEDITDDKDSRILLTKNLLVNLDELASLSRKDINNLKALFSKDKVNERLPYDRKNSILNRVCSFIGSTNMSEFLADETGSVRWLCFNIKKIDWHYKENVNIDEVWAQAYSLFKSDLFAYDMTSAEIQENENRNAKFQILSTEAELIPSYLEPVAELDEFFLTATDILVYMQSWNTGVRLNKVMIGKGMMINGFKRVKNSKTDRWGYYAFKSRDTTLVRPTTEDIKPSAEPLIKPPIGQLKAPF